MISSFSLRFYLKDQKQESSIKYIYLRITISRIKSEIATKLTVDLKDWDDAKQLTKKNSNTNEQLALIKTEVYDVANRLSREKKPISAQAIKNYITFKDVQDAYVLDFYGKYVDRLGKAGEVKEVTVKRYSETKFHIQNFLKARNEEDVLIETITYKFINDFDLYLLRLKDKFNNKILERNTINKHHSRLRTILIRSIKEGYITKNPYKDFKLKNTPSKRTYLTREELDSIMNQDLGGNLSLERVRDIFVFSVYTALRFVDAQNLTTDAIHQDKKGNYTLEILQEKTKEPLMIPIFKDALNIIEKYKDSDERKVHKRILPTISNQKVNAYLKVIADLAGIRKILSHHVARHTCATTILLSNEMPMEVVSKWLGHTNIATTQIYAKITSNYMQEMATKIEQKLELLKT